MLVPIGFGYVRSLSTWGWAGTLPKGTALLMEADGILQSHPGFSSLPALPSRVSTSAGFLAGGSWGAGHIGVTADMALAHQVLYFDCSSTEMSMASQSAYSKENV